MEIDLNFTLTEKKEGINNGCAWCMVMNIAEHTFDAVYWSDNKWSILECDTKFLKLWSVSKTSDIPFYEELVRFADEYIRSL